MKDIDAHELTAHDTALAAKLDASEESGYVMPMTALLLIPLLIFSAFAIDVGAWYLKGQQIQRATDAAALAGVVLMPDLDAAEERALDIAAKNGMIDQDWIDAGNPGVANAEVIVTSRDDQLRVRINAETPAFLGQIVTDDVSVERYSIADIASDIGFGNPTNGLGTGNLGPDVLGQPDSGSYAHGLWLSVSSYCTDYAQGDPFSAGWYDSTYASYGCQQNGTKSNPTFKPQQDMYDYVVDVPDGAGRTKIQIFEPGLCTSGASGSNELRGEQRWGYRPGVGWNRWQRDWGPRIQARLYASDNTPSHDLDNFEVPPVTDRLFGRNDCAGENGWYTLGIVEPFQTGKWYVRINSQDQQLFDEVGLNNFALRAVAVGGDGTLCARSSENPTCPTIYAREWASFFRPGWGDVGTSTKFFMAQIQEEHAGKTLQVRLFDPGEGMHDLQFFNDADEAVDFKWKSTNCSVGKICDDPVEWPEDTELQDAADCGGNPCLLVTGDRYNAEWVTVEYQLPADYTCDSSCWWTVRYDATGGDRPPTDRTTWSVRVVGDPAHLVE